MRNLWRWVPVIWRDRDYDWAFLAEMMETKLRWMGDCLEHGYHVGCERDARRVRVCAALLRRLLNDEYMQNAGYDEKTWKTLPEKRRKQFVEHSQRMAGQDQTHLGRMIGKYLRTWWD